MTTYYEVSKKGTVSERVNQFLQHMKEDNVPVLYYKPVHEEGLDNNYYFEQYFEEGTQEINKGATFSLNKLREKPKGADETWGRLYVQDKSNAGFTIHTAEPNARGGFELRTLVYSIGEAKYEYYKNLKWGATSYTNIETMFSGPRVGLGLHNVLFMLSPKSNPHFYSDMFHLMSCRGNESAMYIGRFFERLVNHPQVEAIKKSGLPSKVVDYFVNSILDSNNTEGLDLTQTSVRLMFRLNKPLWKLALKGEMNCTQIAQYIKAESLREAFNTRGDNSILFNKGLGSFNLWLEKELPVISAYMPSRARELSYGRLNDTEQSALCHVCESKRDQLKKQRILNMSPAVKAYYHRKYKDDCAKTIEAHRVDAIKMNARHEQNIKDFLTAVAHSRTFNEQYGVNYTKRVISGEGILLKDCAGSSMSAIRIHRDRGFSLKRLIEYLYYEVPLSQGYVIRGRKTSGEFLGVSDRTYGDYLRLSSDMTDQYTRYPKNLKTAHDIASANFKLIEDEYMKERLAKQAERMSVYENISIRNSLYMMVAPRTADDFITEGMAMGNCVASYAHSVASGKKEVLFMRAKSAPEHALIDVEIRGEAIVQALQKHNSSLNTDHYEFLKAFAKKAGLKLNI